MHSKNKGELFVFSFYKIIQVDVEHCCKSFYQEEQGKGGKNVNLKHSLWNQRDSMHFDSPSINNADKQ
jgi:hypothetical protein